MSFLPDGASLQRTDEVAKQAKWLSDHMATLAKGRPFSHVQDFTDGRKFLVTYQPLVDGGWVDIQEDITEKRQAEQKIDWLARHDALTRARHRAFMAPRLLGSLVALAAFPVPAAQAQAARPCLS